MFLYRVGLGEAPWRFWKLGKRARVLEVQTLCMVFSHLSNVSNLLFKPIMIKAAEGILSRFFAPSFFIEVFKAVQGRGTYCKKDISQSILDIIPESRLILPMHFYAQILKTLEQRYLTRPSWLWIKMHIFVVLLVYIRISWYIKIAQSIQFLYINYSFREEIQIQGARDISNLHYRNDYFVFHEP